MRRGKQKGLAADQRILMPFQFKRSETISTATRRIAGGELKVIVDQLRRPKNRDVGIHEARKSVKKVRALLRLLEPQMGAQYRSESRVMGKVGRTLSELRDTSAVIETFDAMRKKYPQDLRGNEIARIRRMLGAAKRNAEEKVDIPGVMDGIVKSVDAARKRVKNWPLEEDGFRALEPGFKKTFRAAAKAFAAAQKHRNPENYHEWRKRVKDHWYQVRLLEPLWTDLLRGYENSLEHIETWLGDDHNLTLLRERLMKEKSVDRVLRAIDGYQKELRENADTFGKRVHEEKPGQFIRRMRKLWKEWKAEPKSVREFEKKEF